MSCPHCSPQKTCNYRFDPLVFPDVELPDEPLLPEVDPDPEFPLPELLLEFEPERFFRSEVPVWPELPESLSSPCVWVVSDRPRDERSLVEPLCLSFDFFPESLLEPVRSVPLLPVCPLDPPAPCAKTSEAAINGVKVSLSSFI